MAPWIGLAHLWVVLGVSVANQFLYALRYGPEVGGWIFGASESWLRLAAVSGGITAIVALLSGRLTRVVIAFGVLIVIWQGSGAISAWVRNGDMDRRTYLIAVACVGLAFGVGAAGSAWTGMSLFVLGTTYVWIHLFVLWRNYYSLGMQFPIAGKWWDGTGWVTSPPFAPAGLPFPNSLIDRLFALVETAPDYATYLFQGLTFNSNHTGNYLTPLLVFMASFSARWRPEHASRRLVAARLIAFAMAVAPGYYLLFALQARVALAAVAVSLLMVLVPLGKLGRSPAVAWIAAILAPVVVLTPIAASRVGNLWLSGRSCAWSSWWSAVRQSPVWGLGPGRYPTTCSTAPEGWVHAHNETLQAWLVGGVLGLVAFTLLLSGLTWYALRFLDRDHRALLALMSCGLVLFGLEILSSFFELWVPLGLAGFIAVASRSLALMSQSLEPTARGHPRGEGEPTRRVHRG